MNALARVERRVKCTVTVIRKRGSVEVGKCIAAGWNDMQVRLASRGYQDDGWAW
jgi:hypothetical protein